MPPTLGESESGVGVLTEGGAGEGKVQLGEQGDPRGHRERAGSLEGPLQ